MAPKIFITGITGYIAGDAFYALHRAHPDYEYSALVRTEEKAVIVRKAYPSLRIVLGGLDDSALLEKEAAAADIVLHCADASDHEPAARAIAAGLAAGHSAPHPGYWLHTGGTGILTYTDADSGELGRESSQIYNDGPDVSAVTSLPAHAFHRNVDAVVLESGTTNAASVRTTIVCPPTIYGLGRGPVSGRGRQVYELAKLVLTKRYVPVIGAGKARWNHVHVADLSALYVLLVEAAVGGSSDAELWGAKGYLFAESGEHWWTEIAEKIAAEAEKRGLAGEEKLEKRELEREKAIEQAGFEAESWGLNSRAQALRAKERLGWVPRERSLEEEVPAIVEEEWKRLQEKA